LNADFRTFLFDEEFGGFEGCKSSKQGFRVNSFTLFVAFNCLAGLFGGL